jgi:hypothetical protein
VLALLQEAGAKGYKGSKHKKKDDDPRALRGREDIKKLLSEVGKRFP